MINHKNAISASAYCIGGFQKNFVKLSVLV